MIFHIGWVGICREEDMSPKAKFFRWQIKQYRKIQDDIHDTNAHKAGRITRLCKYCELPTEYQLCDDCCGEEGLKIRMENRGK